MRSLPLIPGPGTTDHVTRRWASEGSECKHESNGTQCKFSSYILLRVLEKVGLPLVSAMIAITFKVRTEWADVIHTQTGITRVS